MGSRRLVGGGSENDPLSARRPRPRHGSPPSRSPVGGKRSEGERFCGRGSKRRIGEAGSQAEGRVTGFQVGADGPPIEWVAGALSVGDQRMTRSAPEGPARGTAHRLAGDRVQSCTCIRLNRRGRYSRLARLGKNFRTPCFALPCVLLSRRGLARPPARRSRRRSCAGPARPGMSLHHHRGAGGVWR